MTYNSSIRLPSDLGVGRTVDRPALSIDIVYMLVDAPTNGVYHFYRYYLRVNTRAIASFIDNRRSEQPDSVEQLQSFRERVEAIGTIRKQNGAFLTGSPSAGC